MTLTDHRRNYILISVLCAMLMFLLMLGWYADVAHAEDIAFTEQDAGRLVVQLEKGLICEDQVTALTAQGKEKDGKIENYESAVSAYGIQIKGDEVTIEQYKKELKEQVAAYDKAIEEEKISIWDKLGYFAEGVAAGVIIVGAFVFLR